MCDRLKEAAAWAGTFLAIALYAITVLPTACVLTFFRLAWEVSDGQMKWINSR